MSRAGGVGGATFCGALPGSQSHWPARAIYTARTASEITSAAAGGHDGNRPQGALSSLVERQHPVIVSLIRMCLLSARRVIWPAR